MTKKNTLVKSSITMIVSVTLMYFIWLSWKILTDLIGDSYVVWIITGVIILIAIATGYFSVKKITDKFN